MAHIRLSWRDVEKLTQDICRQLQLDQWQPDYIVGITRGGAVPAVMLSQYLGLPMHTLKVSLRDGGNDNTESNLWMASDAHNGRNILVVDDINDTGATFDWIMQDWGLPNDPHWSMIWNDTVKFAVLVDNLASACGIKMDYTGMEVNKAQDDCWIDFPWEVWWR